MSFDMKYIAAILILFSLSATFLPGNPHPPATVDSIKQSTQQAGPLELLKSMLKRKYVNEDGEQYQVVLKPGLNDDEINNLAKQLPTGRIPADIRALLKFASGFEFFGLEEISFDAYAVFGFENIFPHSIQLAGDGFGNFWILDIDANGKWGEVFYVCHDPAVIARHSNNLAEFIRHVDEFGRKGNKSHLDIIHEQTVLEIEESGSGGFTELSAARSAADTLLSNFARSLPPNFVIADLRGKPNKSGFAWARFGDGTEKAVRYKSELLWGFEKKAP